MLAGLVIADAVECGKVAQVLHAAHIFVKQRGMSHVADFGGGCAQVSGAQHGDAAARRRRQANHGAQERGLPCPVIAQDGVELARRKFRTQIAQGGKTAENLAYVGKRHCRAGCGLNEISVGRIGRRRGKTHLLRPVAAPGSAWLIVLAGAAGAFCCWGAYLEAHLAWISLAWKTPSRPKLPAASACALSLKVSGGASVPVYTTGSLLPCSTRVNSRRRPVRRIEPGSTLPATRSRLVYT